MTDAWPRAIIHMDLDAFYASVEQQRDPALRGRPVVVGGGRDADGKAHLSRGVVSAASYEARVFGVRSAMPLATALRLCPQAVVVPVDFPAYRAASRTIFAIAREYTPDVEPLSLDEAFLDVTGSQRRFGPPEDIAAEIRDRVFAATELHASFGIATCKVVAKVASDLRKPRGFVVVTPGDEAATLAPLPLRALPGLGPAAATALEGLGVTTLGAVAALPADIVERRLGAHHGRSIWERCHGRDDSAVSVPGRPKSISREETFDTDIGDRERLHDRVRHLAADVGRRARAAHLAGRTVTLKLRYADFTDISRQLAVDPATDADLTLAATAWELLDRAWTGAPVRLLGVGLSGFRDTAQLDLFAAPPGPADSSGGGDIGLDRTLDRLRERFGESAVRRGDPRPLRDLDFRGEDLRPDG